MDEKVDGMVNGNKKMPTTNIDEIIARLKQALKVNSDRQLAKKLGIYGQNISAAKKRGEIPPNWIHKVCEFTGYSMDWLQFGDEPRLRAGFVIERSGDNEKFKARFSEENYNHGVDLEPFDLHEFAVPGEEFGLGYAVEKLSRIYGSKNKILIRAIHLNLDVLIKVLELKEIDRLAIDDLAKRLEAVENELCERGLEIVERRKNNRRMQDIPVENNRHTGRDCRHKKGS